MKPGTNSGRESRAERSGRLIVAIVSAQFLLSALILALLYFGGALKGEIPTANSSHGLSAGNAGG
jgi:hypothetical protein